MSGVAREQDEVAIGEHVARRRRQQLRETHVAVDANANVGENRIDQTVGNDANHALHRFIRPNEFRGASTFHRELLEKRHIDI